MNIAEVIAWKFNNKPGMRCKEVDGVLTIISFPGGIPSQADQDLWTTEYENRPPSVIISPSNLEIRLEVARIADTDVGIKALLEAIEDRLGIPRESLKNDALSNYS